MPRPLTGAAGVSPLPSEEGSAQGWIRRWTPVPAVANPVSESGAAGAAFLAPGRRAPAAMPRPLTSGSGFAGCGRLGLRLSFGRLAAQVRAGRRGLGDADALTSGSGLAGASASASGAAVDASGSAFGGPRPSWRRSSCSRCDAKPLTSGSAAGSAAAGASGAAAAAAAVFLAPGRLAPPAMPRPLTGAAAAAGCFGGLRRSRRSSWRRGVSRRRRCRGP